MTAPAAHNLPSARLFQCVPNFSEGRNLCLVDEIAAAIRATPGALLIDHSADTDHNRCVMTILGDGGSVRAAALAAARIAVRAIDLRCHEGVHPRIGAIDVLPVVPLRSATMEEAVAVADAIAHSVAAELDLPVYLYEASARPGHRSDLPALRRGGFEGLVGRALEGSLAPDLGPPQAHVSAGVAVIGARGPLVAYNVNLGTADLSAARAIAGRIRSERAVRPELEGVRALGLLLAGRGRAQVSMNLTRPGRTSIPAVFRFVAEEAAALGVTDLESEIIGVIPVASLGGEPPESIRWTAFSPTQLLETWIGP